MHVASRPTAWTISLAAHAAVAVALAIALGRGHHQHEQERPPARLVYVEPVAPPLAGGAAAAEGAAVPVPPTAEHAPDASLPPVPSDPARLSARRARVAATARPATTPRAAARAPDRPQPPPDAAALGNGTGGAAVGDPHGAVGGAPGGAVGGIGDAPLPLRDVAAPPELLERVIPEYPPRARAMQIEGQVTLEVVLDRDGRVEETVRVLRSVPALDAAAIAAVRRWRFRPARGRDGRPVRVVMEVPVRFVLR